MNEEPRLASTSQFYVYKKRDHLAIAVNPPLIPLPDDALFWTREREDALAWIEAKERRIA